MNTSPHTEESCYVTLGYIRPLLDYLQNQKITLDRPLEVLGIQAEQLQEADLRVADSRIVKLFSLAEELSQDSNIGLHAGMAMQSTHLGILGHMILSCTQMRQVFELHSRYCNLMSNSASHRYIFSDENICLHIKKAPNAPAWGHQAWEFNIAAWTTLARWLTQYNYAPSHVQLPFPAPKDTKEQEQLFRCPIEYGVGDDIYVYFPSEYANIQLLSGDNELKTSLEHIARKRLLKLQGEYHDHDPILAQVKQQIGRSLKYGVPTLDAIAETLNMSPRKLQRHLENKGTHYTGVVETVRKHQVHTLIEDASISLVDAALLLGFSEQSSFQRAFKRWFKVTPKAYRQKITD
ncbi:MAG: AraC family transcriptional regulator [Spongiibacteraceae bacterium]